MCYTKINNLTTKFMRKLFTQLLLACSFSMLLVGCNEPEATLPPQQIIEKIDLSISDITETSATISAETASTDITFYVDLITTAKFEEYDSEEEYMSTTAEKLIESEVITTLLSKESYVKTYNELTPETSYTAVAFYIDDKGKLIEGDTIYTSEFTTKKQIAQLSISAGNITHNSAEVTSTSTLGDDYFVGNMDEATFNTLPADELASSLVETIEGIASNNNSSFKEAAETIGHFTNSESTTTFENLNPESSYITFALALNDQGEFDADVVVVSEKYTTTEVPAAITITMISENIRSVDVATLIDSQDDTYYIDAMARETYDNMESDADIMSAVVEGVKTAAESSWMDLEGALSLLLKKGDKTSLHIDMLEPATEYYVFAFKLASDGTYSSDQVISKLAITTKQSPGTAEAGPDNLVNGSYDVDATMVAYYGIPYVNTFKFGYDQSYESYFCTGFFHYANIPFTSTYNSETKQLSVVPGYDKLSETTIGFNTIFDEDGDYEGYGYAFVGSGDNCDEPWIINVDDNGALGTFATDATLALAVIATGEIDSVWELISADSEISKADAAEAPAEVMTYNGNTYRRVAPSEHHKSIRVKTPDKFKPGTLQNLKYKITKSLK